MTNPACYRVATLAERWDCSTGKVRALIRSGELPALRFGKLIRIPIAAVEAYEAKALVPAKGQQDANATPKAPCIGRGGTDDA